MNSLSDMKYMKTVSGSLKLVLASILLFSLASCSGLKNASSDILKDHKNKPKAQQVSQDYFNDEETLGSRVLEGNYFIAVGAPLTGPYRELGKTILEGVELALEDFNKKANANQRVGLLIIDDGGLVGEAMEHADLVIAQNALGVIGHLNSSVSIEASKKYVANKVPQISPASTHPHFTERPDFRGYVFRTIGTDRQLGEIAANYVSSKPELKRIAVLYNDKPYGISVSGEFVRRLAKDTSKEVVFYKTIPVRRVDHSETAKKVAKLKPDLVFFIGEYNDAGYLVQELKTRLPGVQFLGGEGVHSQEFINIAKKDAEGAIVLAAGSLDPSLKRKYLKRFKKEDASFVHSSYKAAKILLDALKKNNFKDTSAIAKTIASNSVFDPNGDLIHPNFVLYQVEDSKFVKI